MQPALVPKKLSFEQGGDFIAETRREVEPVPRVTAHARVGRAQLYAKTFVAFALVAASWATLIFVQPGVVLGIVALAGMALGAMLDRVLRPARREPRRVLPHAAASTT